MKIMIALLLALPLMAPARVPAAPVVYHTTIAIVQSAAQSCAWENAPARLSQRIYDPIGYPYGEVAAWSCTGDSQAVIAELQARTAEMQALAAAYRQAHPIVSRP